MSKMTRIPLLAAGLAAMLAGCAPGENGGTNNIVGDVQSLTSARASGLSPAQQALAQRQRDYAKVRVQAAGGGAVAGALGCMLAKCSREQTIAMAAAGAAAGYLAGGYLTNQNARFQATQETLQNDIRLAREDNAKLAGSVQAARQVVSFQQGEISRLNAGLNNGSVTTAQYRSELKTIQADVAATQSLRDTSEKRLAGLDNSIARHRAAGLATGDLVAQRNAQQRQISELRQAEQQMLSNIGRAPAAVKS